LSTFYGRTCNLCMIPQGGKDMKYGNLRGDGCR